MKLIIVFLINLIYCEYRGKIVIPEDGELKILQLTDLHYGEGVKGDIYSTNLTKKLLNYTNPDLVIITGDLVSGYSWDKRNRTFFQSCWEMFTSAMTLPYGYVLGNHDAQADLDREAIVKLDRSHNYSLIDSMLSRSSNYYIPVYNNDGKIALILWMFDTNSESCDGMEDSWGCFEGNEIEWYEKESNRLKNELGYMPKGLAFFHIPIPEYLMMHNWSRTYGTRNELISCPRKNTQLFRSMLNMNNIKATFCGHDHDNDEGGIFYGIELVYGRKTGYGGYGPYFFQRGGRIIKLKLKDNDFNYSHYIIQEDGTLQDNEEPRWKGGYDFMNRCAK